MNRIKTNQIESNQVETRSDSIRSDSIRNDLIRCDSSQRNLRVGLWNAQACAAEPAPLVADPRPRRAASTPWYEKTPRRPQRTPVQPVVRGWPPHRFFSFCCVVSVLTRFVTLYTKRITASKSCATMLRVAEKWTATTRIDSPLHGTKADPPDQAIAQVCLEASQSLSPQGFANH